MESSIKLVESDLIILKPDYESVGSNWLSVILNPKISWPTVCCNLSDMLINRVIIHW